MANIRVDLNHAPIDGETVSFKAPCNASSITGLVIHYANDSGAATSREFTLSDANGGNIGLLDNVFAEGAIVKVILDTDANNAFVQNPDTNTYLEGRFADLAGQYATATMLASGWSGNKYSFEAEYPSEEYNIEVTVADTATVEQFEAAGAAYIGSSATSNVFTARGDVPTVDIPVIVKAVKK